MNPRNRIQPLTNGVTRRNFTTTVVSATTVAALGAIASNALATLHSDLPIVDTHQHLWDLQKLRLDWLKGSTNLNRSFLMEDYLAATEGLNVKRAVYMEVDVVHEDKAKEAEFVIDLCKSGKSPTVAGVIGGDLLSKDFEEYAKRFAESSYIKGVRHILNSESGGKTLLDEAFVQQIRLLGKLKLRFDICMRPDQLSSAAEVTAKAPETRFVLDHCGNADVMAFVPELKRTRKADHIADDWRKGVAQVAKRPNVVCKLSGIIAKVKKDDWKASDLKPIVEHCVECFGLDRVIFASDWPVCLLGASLSEWVGALRELTAQYGQESQQKIFHDNAVKFYELG